MESKNQIWCRSSPHPYMVDCKVPSQKQDSSSSMQRHGAIHHNKAVYGALFGDCKFSLLAGHYKLRNEFG